MVYGYFLWWYGEGFLQAWKWTKFVLFRIFDFFSLDILIRTWVAPWKNDVVTAQNVSLGDQFKLWQMNAVSRFIGAFVRTLVIAIAALILILCSVASLVALASWLLVPLLYLILPVVAGYVALNS